MAQEKDMNALPEKDMAPVGAGGGTGFDTPSALEVRHACRGCAPAPSFAAGPAVLLCADPLGAVKAAALPPPVHKF